MYISNSHYKDTDVGEHALNVMWIRDCVWHWGVSVKELDKVYSILCKNLMRTQNCATSGFAEMALVRDRWGEASA